MEVEATPKRVTVIKSITYDVEQIIADLKAQGKEDATYDDAIEMIEEFVKDDFSCGWGHEADTDGLTYIDPDTNEEI